MGMKKRSSKRKEDIFIPLEYVYLDRLLLFESSKVTRYKIAGLNSTTSSIYTSKLRIGSKRGKRYYIYPKGFGNYGILRGYRKSV